MLLFIFLCDYYYSIKITLLKQIDDMIIKLRFRVIAGPATTIHFSIAMNEIEMFACILMKQMEFNNNNNILLLYETLMWQKK